MQGQVMHSNGSGHLSHTAFGELHDSANAASPQIVNDFPQARFGPIISLQQLNGAQNMDS